MIARRLSIFLSITAMCFMALACSLGWRSGEREGVPQAVQDTTATAHAVADQVKQRCRKLDDQFLTCSDALERVWRPETPAHYPEKVKRLLAIKRRFEMENEASRACRGEPDAPVATGALEDCLGRRTCDGFANCVADAFDPFE